MYYTFLTLSLTSLVIAHYNLISPCPRFFLYETKRKEPDKWYGILTMLSDFDTYGVYVHISLNKPALQFGNWYSKVYTEDNQEFILANSNDGLKANVSKTIQFFVKYNTSEPPPVIEWIVANSRKICPDTKITETTTRALVSTTSASVQLDFKPKPSPVTEISKKPGGGLIGKAPAPSKNENFYKDDLNLLTTLLSSKKDLNVLTPLLTNETFARPSSVETITNKPANGFIGQGSAANEDEDFYMSDFSEVLDTLLGKETGDSTVNDVCGTVVVPPDPLITYGQPTNEGEFPWHVAIYHSSGIDLTYICGATLVSQDFVITVAHCVAIRRSSNPLNPDNLTLYLGKHYLKRNSNLGIQVRQVSEIIIHADYNAQMYSNNIALLKLELPVEYTDYVRPICLWQESSNLNSIVDRQGKIVGWGFDETGIVTDHLMQTEMPVVSQDTCLLSYPEFYSRYTSEGTFCAGFRNGTTICNGDSGGGMVFPKSNSNPKNPVWQLRGLISISPPANNKYKCDASHYVVFTDAAKYVGWIKNKIK